MDSGMQINNRDARCELFSNNCSVQIDWIKVLVKREVSLVSFRNFWFLSCEDKWYDVCLVISGMSVVKWHESRHFPFVFVHHCCFDERGISLTTWMVVGETDKWSTNFKFSFTIFFVVHHIEWELCFKQYFAVLT